MHSAIGIVRHRLGQHGQIHLAPTRYCPDYREVRGRISGVPWSCQFQQAHAESAQGSLGLLSCSQLRVEHSIVQEEQGKGNDDAAPSMYAVMRNSRNRLPSAASRSRVLRLAFVEQRISLADTPIICCRSRACSRVSRDPPRFN